MTTPSDAFPARFDSLSSHIGARDPEWLTPLRRDAIERFPGFPTTRDEEWKYTSLRELTKHDFTPVVTPELGGATPETLAHLAYEGLEHRLVFVNGHYAPDLSHTTTLPDGVIVCSLGEALEQHADLVQGALADSASLEHPFGLLNVAFALDGLFVHVPRGKVLETPIHLLHVASAMSTPLVASPRHVIALGETAQATLVEQYVGLSEHPYLVNARTEIRLAQSAHLTHYRVQQEHDVAGFHISTVEVHQVRDSVYRNVAFNLGGKLIRNDLATRIDGSGVESHFNGLYLARDNQLLDNHTSIDHAQPHSNSWELYKGILDGSATAIFNGKVFVRQIAQKTDAKQSNMNLLLSDTATINTKPQLEIWADDVRCTHGATVGHLDDDKIFYLQARGISLSEAREMLLLGFAGEIIEMVQIESLRESLQAELVRWMPNRREEQA